MTTKHKLISTQMTRRVRSPEAVWVAAALLVGGFFRIHQLGLAALRADTITFWNICLKTSGPGQVFREWMQLMGICGQFPFATAATKWFLSVTGLEQTFATLRLPAAIWGTAAVLAAYFVGREFKNSRTGLLAAAITALNPFLIQVSREAYFYPPLVLGAYLMLWASFRAMNRRGGNGSLGTVFVLATVGGFFLLTWSQPTGWILAIVSGVAVLWLLLQHDVINHRVSPATAATVAGYLAVGIPLLVAPWGLRHLIANASGPTKEAALKALEVSGRGLGDLLYDFLTVPSWGGTPLRLAVSILLLGVGLWQLVRAALKAGTARLLILYFVGGLVFYLIFRAITGAQYAVRYLCALVPVYLLVLTAGMERLAGWAGSFFPRPSRYFGLATTLIPLSLLGLQVYPAWLCTQLTGLPTPYKDIVAWCNTNLPPGTLVLVDRWFEPWNELRVHASTNVHFTFTIPNEPVDVFLQNRWRETARSFLERNPGAAYLEIAKEYWDVPEVGPWRWPRSFFRRHHAITNEAGLALRRLHLAAREDFYASNTNRVIVEFFYDRKADILEKWRRSGRSLGVLYGPGWGYTKSKDYRDWRVFQGRATLFLENISNQPRKAVIEIEAMAYGGTKKVKLGPQLGYTFTSGKLDLWRAGPVLLPPGETAAELRDDLWDVSHIPLLVSNIRIIQMGPDSATTSFSAK